MSRVTEATPLLVNDRANCQSHPQSRRNVWQFVLAGALSLGVLSLFQQQHSVDIADVTVSFDEVRAVMDDADDVAFLSSMETFKDSTVDPCVDFYEYACGGWLKSHEIPSDRPRIDSSFYVVSESNKGIIQQIMDQNPPQIGPFYHSCLSDEEMDASAVAFVTQWINNVHQVNSTLALMELAGKMDQTLGISTFFSLAVGADPQDPSTNVLQLAQGGLTLPSREYYLEQSKVDTYAALYVNYVTKLFAVGDLDHYNVSELAETVLKIETAFANFSLPNAALHDPWTTRTAYPFAEIAQRYPFLMAYLNGIYKQESFPMLHAVIATPNFFEAQNQLLSDEALLPQLKKYLSFHLIDSFSTLLGEYFRRVSHDFHGKIQGAGNLLPRNQFCMRLTTAVLGDELGKYYMQRVFGPDAKSAAEALVVEIEESFKALLQTEAWLDKVTYDAAVEKLSKVKNFIGGPDDVPPLPFELQANAFFDNMKRLMQLRAARTIQSVGKPVNEKAWDMSASTVNAYYDPSANKMVFPAAILQPPFYSAEHFPAAANFARIGMIMGHELSHGFDDQGRNYDGNGALRSWWTPSASAKFAEKAQCLVAQYSAFPVVSIEDGRVLGNVNGKLTLGENIADNGGIHLAYEAYHLWKRTLAPPPTVPSSEVPPATTTPNATVVPPPDEQAPKPAHAVPSDNIPAATPAPVVPISVPEPIKTGPGEHSPVPPALPVPKAKTPEATPSEPDGKIPVGIASQPPVVPEPQPADIGPSETIPHGTTPAPKLPTPAEQVPAPPGQESTTKTPAVTPVSSTPPTLPGVPNTPPSLPNGSTPLTPPDLPDTPSPPNVPTPSEVPTVVPKPEPGVVSPDKTSKLKHKKGEDEPPAEPEQKDRTEKQKRHEGGSEKDKKSGKPDSTEADDNRHSSHKSHKYSSEEHENKERGKEKSHDSKHNHEENEDNGKEDKSSKKKHSERYGKHDRDADHDKRSSYKDEEECGDCERKGQDGHHHKHEKDKHEERHGCRKEDTDCGSRRHEWALSESKYPFSGGNARIQSMVKKLARAIVQPNDPVADHRLFFTAFAQSWCEKRTPGYAELLRTIDSHSPGKWRVNGPLMNYAKFAEVFSCPVGTPMNPEKKCVIW